MFYIKEEERGFYPEEDLIIPGRYEVVIKPRETKEITFVASLEDNTEQIDSNKVFEEEINRLEKIIENTELIKQKSKLSKQDKDYNELVKYGFKNVDYFKSIIRADSYFAEHPEDGVRIPQTGEEIH